MILHCLRLGRPADAADISDLTASVRTAPAYWFACEEHAETPGDCLDMPLDPEPSEDECQAIRRRLVTVDAADEARIAQVAADLADPGTPSWAKSLLQIELARYEAQAP